jgi:hypothetical protein
MAFTDIQDRVVTLVKNVSGYTARNTSAADYRMFTKGLSKAVVVKRGPSSSARGSTNAGGTMSVLNDWGVNIEIWIPYRKNSKATRDKLEAELNSVSGELNKWPKLNALSGVVHHDTGTPFEPEEFLQISGADGTWFRQVLQMRVLEQEAISTSE